MQRSDKAAVELGADVKAIGEGRVKAGKLNDQARNRLGLHLRAMYAEIVSQPVPDRFTDLISRLDQVPREASDSI